jgi:hypothetical protein
MSTKPSSPRVGLRRDKWRSLARRAVSLVQLLGLFAACPAAAFPTEREDREASEAALIASGIVTAGARGVESSTAEVTSGIHARSASPVAGSIGLVGEATATSGASFGVAGISLSPQGVAGRFEGVAGSYLIRGLASGAELFSVSGAGVVTAAAFVGGASSVAYGDLECTGCVSGSELVPGSLGSSRLADGAVGPAKLADGAVGAAEIAVAAVTRPKIAAGAVETAKLANDAVTSAKLAAGGVLSSKLGASSVLTAALADGAVDATRINGTERVVYIEDYSCGDAWNSGLRFTRSPICYSSACFDLSGNYNDCDNTQPCVAVPDVCVLSDRYKVLSPDILP